MRGIPGWYWQLWLVGGVFFVGWLLGSIEKYQPAVIGKHYSP